MRERGGHRDHNAGPVLDPSDPTCPGVRYVRSDVERRELELLIAEIQGVVRVSNQLLTFR